QLYFCNYTQKNKKSAISALLSGPYICKPDFSSMKQLFRKLKVLLERIMRELTNKIQHFFEQYAFGVCTRLGEKLGVATSTIRLFFIYTSFITFGSPVIIYLVLAFIMNI